MFLWSGLLHIYLSHMGSLSMLLLFVILEKDAWVEAAISMHRDMEKQRCPELHKAWGL